METSVCAGVSARLRSYYPKWAATFARFATADAAGVLAPAWPRRAGLPGHGGGVAALPRAAGADPDPPPGGRPARALAAGRAARAAGGDRGGGGDAAAAALGRKLPAAGRLQPGARSLREAPPRRLVPADGAAGDARDPARDHRRLWDAMDEVSEAAIERIEQRLVRSLLERGELDDGELLVFDPDQPLHPPRLGQRAGRAAPPRPLEAGPARPCARSLALMTTRRHQLPLLHYVYAGDRPDAPTLREVDERLGRRFGAALARAAEVTVVCDRGSHSDAAVTLFEAGELHFVCDLQTNRYRERLELAPAELAPLPALPGYQASRSEVAIAGRRYILLTVRSRALRPAAGRGLPADAREGAARARGATTGRRRRSRPAHEGAAAGARRRAAWAALSQARARRRRSRRSPGSTRSSSSARPRAVAASARACAATWASRASCSSSSSPLSTSTPAKWVRRRRRCEIGAHPGGNGRPSALSFGNSR
jgi:hypothetical protein